MSFNFNRFGRDYNLLIRDNSRLLEINPPFRIAFSGTKATNGFGLNKINISIYGLSEDKREFLTKDAEEKKLVAVELSIGYEGNVDSLFSGQLHKGYNQLTNNGFVTTIEVYDGGFDYFNSYVSTTVKGRANAINSIISEMPNTAKGTITLPTELIRPKVLVGNPSSLFQQMIGPDYEFFIDDGKVNIIGNDEFTGIFVPVISAQTGLLNTPMREFQKVTFETLLNPAVKIASRVSLQSIVAPQYDGLYKVQSIVYQGDLQGPDWKQSITGFLAKDVRLAI